MNNSEVITDDVKKALAIAGSIGGRAARGKKKRRSMAHYVRMAKISNARQAEKRKAAA